MTTKRKPGRPKGTIKGQKIYKQIQVEVAVYAALNRLKKQRKSKNWSEFFTDVYNIK